MSSCPKCNRPTEKRNGMFHYRGDWFSGLVCVPCNALYDNPEDSFMEFVKTGARASSDVKTKEEE